MSRSRQPESDVRTSSVLFAQGHVWRKRTSTWPELVFGSRGAISVHTSDNTWLVPTHRALLVPAGVRHDIAVPTGVTLRSVYFRDLPRRRAPRACRSIQITPLLRELLRRTFQLDTLSRRVREQRNLIEVLLDQLAEVPFAPISVPMPRDPRALRAATLVRETPDAAHKLDEVAKRAGASSRTLERLFRDETGMSFGAWRQRARLGRAVQLLADGATVTNAAIAVGYESTSAFVAAFRRATGVTPGRYFKPAERADR